MKVFLSAVSSQFKTCRDALASDLRAIGCEVHVQEDFQQGTATLLHRLQDDIASCDRVIALVGDAFGSPAPDVSAARWRGGLRSYAQWEYAFAIGERLDGVDAPSRELHVYLASAAYLGARAVQEPEDARRAQQSFLDRVKTSGKHWSTFDTDDDLCRRVLRDVWRIDGPRAASLVEYLQARVAEWSAPRHALDRTFTPLTLRLDEEEPEFDAPVFRTTRDPHQLLALAQPACLLLGPPGGGKSTLLRRLDLDLARQALAAPDRSRIPIPVHVSLGRYRRVGASSSTAALEWLEQEWTALNPDGGAFDALLRSGRLVLLLDALDEMPHADDARYREAVGDWREFVALLARIGGGSRAIISCREGEYTVSLSTSDVHVSAVRIERLDDDQVRDFIAAYGGALPGPDAPSEASWLDLCRSPYYLRLAMAQQRRPAADGRRAALFTSFVRRALAREVEVGNPLFDAGSLLDAHDHANVVRRRWHGSFGLPRRGPLFPALERLAFDLQQQAGAAGVPAQRDHDTAIDGIGQDESRRIVRAGVALQVLDADAERFFFSHRLLQAYFAARHVAGLSPAAQSALLDALRKPWRADEVVPPLAQALDMLAPDDPLAPWPSPPLADALPMALTLLAEPLPALERLADVDLALAGRCAVELGPGLPSEWRVRLQQRLLERSVDAGADVRARIAAGRALGELGDPRLRAGRGPDGEYRLPEMVELAAGDHVVGLDHGGRSDEAPAHRVALAAFRIGRRPVSNAEFACFVRAGGYDDPRWWQGDAARRWREGRDTGRLARLEWLAERRHWALHPELLSQMQREGRMTSAHAAYWAAAGRLSEPECEQWLDRMYVAGRQTAPRFWSDPAFNHPAHPVVGVCWFEARAYCAWLGAQSGLEFVLPSEVQWEAAARGPEGRLFPCAGSPGLQSGNTAELRLQRTTPVGVFPQGATPEGVQDLLGNVWEWTSSSHAPYPYRPQSHEAPDKEVPRVARGAAYSFGLPFARATYRYHVAPDARRSRIGFRLACPSGLV